MHMQIVFEVNNNTLIVDSITDNSNNKNSKKKNVMTSIEEILDSDFSFIGVVWRLSKKVWVTKEDQIIYQELKSRAREITWWCPKQNPTHLSMHKNIQTYLNTFHKKIQIMYQLQNKSKGNNSITSILIAFSVLLLYLYFLFY